MDIGKVVWKICVWWLIFPLSCLTNCIHSTIDEYELTKESLVFAEEVIDSAMANSPSPPKR